MLRPCHARKLVLALSLATVQAGILRAQASNQQVVLELLRDAGTSMQQGDLSKAKSEFQQAVDAAPSLSDAYLGLGLVELKRGELDQSAKALTRAIELNPRLPGAHLFLGIVQYQTGQSAAAAVSLRDELALQPRSVEALTWLGIVELGEGNPDRATAPLDQAAVLNPHDPQALYYRARAHMLVSEEAYQQLSQLDPDSALVHRGMAESYSIAGQPDKAIAEYEIAIKKEPRNPDLYEALGEANQKISRVDASRAAYEAELQLNPHSSIALYNIGRIDVERGKPAEGVAILREAADSHASAAPTDFYLGLGLAELGQNEEAAQWLEKALANQPSAFVQQGAWYQLARVYQKLNRKTDAQHALDQLKILLAQLQAQKEITAKQAVAQTPHPTDIAAPQNR